MTRGTIQYFLTDNTACYLSKVIIFLGVSSTNMSFAVSTWPVSHSLQIVGVKTKCCSVLWFQSIIRNVAQLTFSSLEVFTGLLSSLYKMGGGWLYFPRSNVCSQPNHQTNKAEPERYYTYFNTISFTLQFIKMKFIVPLIFALVAAALAIPTAQSGSAPPENITITPEGDITTSIAIREPENTRPGYIPTEWDRIKHKPGAVRFCTEENYKGTCWQNYDATAFGKCSDLWKPFDRQISSIRIGQGGQCCFWPGKSCWGQPHLLFFSGRKVDSPTLLLKAWDMSYSLDNTFRSFTCWGDLDIRHGTA